MDLFCITIRYVKGLGVLEGLWLLGVLSIGNFSAVAAVHLVLECVGCSVENAVYHHPSPLLCFYK